jgi:basic membrane lipoprotein Med (substrate-binding protein (PBP1-ABC) superfamily)
MTPSTIAHFALASSLLLISACSPHPGSATWLVTADQPATFTKIAVRYDGKADIYSNNQENAVRRCFWSAVSAQSINLHCIVANNTEHEEDFQLTVTNKDHAELTQSSTIIARYYRQQP